MGNHRHPRKIIGYAEIDFQVSSRSNSHTADDDIKLPRDECRDNAGPFGRDKLYFDAHVFCQAGGHIDFKTD